MQKLAQFITLVFLVITLSACSSLSRKVPIEQGNVFNQAMVNQLKPGMSMAQAEQIMGTPVLSNNFDPNRLDYVYSFRQGKEYKYQRVSLIFKDNKLQRVTGTLIPGSTDQ